MYDYNDDGAPGCLIFLVLLVLLSLVVVMLVLFQAGGGPIG